MARLTTAAFTNWGRAPTIVIIVNGAIGHARQRRYATTELCILPWLVYSVNTVTLTPMPSTSGRGLGAFALRRFLQLFDLITHFLGFFTRRTELEILCEIRDSLGVLIHRQDFTHKVIGLW